MSSTNEKVAVVTGGASGIGFAIAKQLVETGYKVAILDLNPNLPAELDTVIDAEDHYLLLKTDVSSAESVNNAFDAIDKTFGRTDVLVNCAGMNIGGDTESIDEADWDTVVSVNLKSVYLTCKAALPKLKASNQAAIINVASLSGMAADYGFPAYNAAKAGVINYTKNLALDYCQHGIRVNSISPGPVATPILSDLMKNKALMDAWNKAVPMGRFASPTEIANVAIFLISENASFMTGANIPVDGGMSAATGQPNITSFF